MKLEIICPADTVETDMTDGDLRLTKDLLPRKVLSRIRDLLAYFHEVGLPPVAPVPGATVAALAQMLLLGPVMLPFIAGLTMLGTLRLIKEATTSGVERISDKKTNVEAIPSVAIANAPPVPAKLTEYEMTFLEALKQFSEQRDLYMTERPSPNLSPLFVPRSVLKLKARYPS